MSVINWRRKRAVAVSRAFKSLFRPTETATKWLAAFAAAAIAMFAGRAWLQRWYYRVVFTADGQQLRRAAEHVLADLRDFSFARATAFDRDPIIMARREGRRDVWLRISGYLNLDEAQVQLLMEIDDGN